MKDVSFCTNVFLAVIMVYYSLKKKLPIQK